MRLALIAALIATPTLAASAMAQTTVPAAQSAPSPAKVKYGPQSTFRELAADPRARALLDQHIPLVMGVFDMGLFPDSATLKLVSDDPQAQSGGGFTPEVYQKLLADLAKL